MKDQITFIDAGLISPEDQEKLLQEIEKAFNELIKESEFQFDSQPSDIWSEESEYEEL